MTVQALMLDTHVLLWMLTDPVKLTERVRVHVTNRRHPLVVSAASTWEIATKQLLGNLPEADVGVQVFW